MGSEQKPDGGSVGLHPIVGRLRRRQAACMGEISREAGDAADEIERMRNDTRILELSLSALSSAFNEFIGECSNGAPNARAVAKARGYLPPDCSHSYAKHARSPNAV